MGNPAVNPEVTVTQGTFLVQALGSRQPQVLVCSSKGIRRAQPLPEIQGCRAQGWHHSALCPERHAALYSSGVLVQVCTASAPCQPTSPGSHQLHAVWEVLCSAHTIHNSIPQLRAGTAGLAHALAPWIC